MLSITNLRCEVGQKTLLHIDQLQLAVGQLVALLGPNGAGKSTLLKAISGDRPSVGHIVFHGSPLSAWKPSDRARHLGVLPQSSQLDFRFTAAEVVALGLIPLSVSQREGQRAVRTEMARTDCIHLADTPYPQLSGGEKQRVHLARVLLQLSQATHAPLLLLDEPTSAQDLGQQHAILELARQLCQDRDYACLAILHDLNQVLAYCDYCYILDQGEVKEHGVPERCLRPETIQQYWGYWPEQVECSNASGFVVI